MRNSKYITGKRVFEQLRQETTIFMMDADMSQSELPAASSDGSWLQLSRDAQAMTPEQITAALSRDAQAMTPQQITAAVDIFAREDPWAVAAGMQTGMQPAIQAARSHQGHLPMPAGTLAQLGP